MSIYQVVDTAKEHLTRSVASTSSLFRDSVPVDDLEIRKLVNSSSSRDKALGLKAILTKVGDGVDCHHFFADVVKNVNSKDIEVREMTSAFLIMFSQHEPELTLMIVNSVQKMLGETSAVVRMQALRLASALRVATVAPIVVHFITEVMNDVSPLVRIACFQAIGKCYELDPSLGDELLELLLHMLGLPKQLNGDYDVAGWGLATLALHWPQRIDLLHPIFRVYVPHISKFNEWCQIAVCRMLVRYCRHFINGPDNEDCQLFAESVVPLLYSLNDAVVVEAAAAILYVGLPTKFEDENVAERLLALSRTELTTANILLFCYARPDCFAAQRSQIVKSIAQEDLPAVRQNLLKCVAHCRGAELRRTELFHLKLCAVSWQNDQKSLRELFRVISRLAGPKTVHNTMRWLVKLATDKQNAPELISESLMCLRIMVQQHNMTEISSILETLTELATNEQVLPPAKATIIWLIGTHCLDHPGMATDLLRRLLQSLASEEACVHLQALNLAAKLLTAFRSNPEGFDKRIPQFFDYCIKLCRYDQDVDVRDRARLFSSLLRQEDNSLAVLLLQAETPIPATTELRSGGTVFLPGTASAFFDKRLNAYACIEPWATENTTNDLRCASLQLSDSESHTEYTESPALSDYGTKKSNLKAAEKHSAKKMTFEEFLNPSKEERNQSELETSSEGSEEEEEEEEEDDESDNNNESNKETEDKIKDKDAEESEAEAEVEARITAGNEA